MTYTIRAVEEGDKDSIYDIFNSRTALLGTMRLPYQSKSNIANRIAPQNGVTGLVALAEDQVVGFAALLTNHDTPRHAHVGELNIIATNPEWQGKGVARSLIDAVLDMADNWMNLRRVSLSVWHTNTRAIKLYESYGFEREGVMRDYVYCDGRYLDAIYMGRLKT